MHFPFRTHLPQWVVPLLTLALAAGCATEEESPGQGAVNAEATGCAFGAVSDGKDCRLALSTTRCGADAVDCSKEPRPANSEPICLLDLEAPAIRCGWTCPPPLVEAPADDEFGVVCKDAEQPEVPLTCAFGESRDGRLCRPGLSETSCGPDGDDCTATDVPPGAEPTCLLDVAKGTVACGWRCPPPLVAVDAPNPFGVACEEPETPVETSPCGFGETSLDGTCRTGLDATSCGPDALDCTAADGIPANAHGTCALLLTTDGRELACSWLCDDGFRRVVEDGTARCEPRCRACERRNGSGEQCWSDVYDDYELCRLDACDDGFHLVGEGPRPNCESDCERCDLRHGDGCRMWDGQDFTGPCVAARCDSGYSLVDGACRWDGVCPDGWSECPIDNGLGCISDDPDAFRRRCQVFDCDAGFHEDRLPDEEGLLSDIQCVPDDHIRSCGVVPSVDCVSALDVSDQAIIACDPVDCPEQRACPAQRCSFTCADGAHPDEVDGERDCFADGDVRSCTTHGDDCREAPIPENADPTCTPEGCGHRCSVGFAPAEGPTCVEEHPDLCGPDGVVCPAGPDGSLRTCRVGTCGWRCDLGGGFAPDGEGGCEPTTLDLRHCLQQTGRDEGNRATWLCMNNSREHERATWCGDVPDRFSGSVDATVFDNILGGDWLIVHGEVEDQAGADIACASQGPTWRLPHALELASLVTQRSRDTDPEPGVAAFVPGWLATALEDIAEPGFHAFWSGTLLDTVPPNHCGVTPDATSDAAYALAAASNAGFLFPTPTPGFPYPVVCFRPGN